MREGEARHLLEEWFVAVDVHANLLSSHFFFVHCSMRVLYYRDCRTINRIQIAKVTVSRIGHSWLQSDIILRRHKAHSSAHHFLSRLNGTMTLSLIPRQVWRLVVLGDCKVSNFRTDRRYCSGSMVC